ncbi:hypothetical protein RF11_05063 [Thelohanellus kitauei]|uniref:Uncharacterized protein n=1 Tax=Thelohanellus kitauei TaxID=669202 RepID=A0A0C2NH55_THEKT|nr:hypothetical protein RF11_05063 [Thelohanellus kitauei]
MYCRQKKIAQTIGRNVGFTYHLRIVTTAVIQISPSIKEFCHPLSGTTIVKKFKLTYNHALTFEYSRLSEVKNKLIEVYTSNYKRTITLYKKYLRQLVSDSIDFNDLKIGGDGIVVEINETKIDKNKHHRGHLVNRA